eukprot:CAMPEP_0205819942 /NCGR_PEP_ID=MMETSP0206-20130828/2480_1 /ASSEMBLY_ACC=CAM_ASM_000279 /TAXON_ID=36767 /ORGANISM="Euplotes focardii, Strain TN1" /LENGTH=671 /DNA_ID=CAMNT_0053114115 /DNA_START=42 /DNA_END=2057 /DNA_ORIENTATION=-
MATPSPSKKLKVEAYVPKSILLTGGAGFIGSHVVAFLMKEYPNVKMTVLDSLAYCGTLKNLNAVAGLPNFKFVKGNVQNMDLVSYIFESERIDTILHFAAETHVDNSFGNSLSFTHSNVVGTHTILECCNKFKKQIRRVIHVSTDEVYGGNTHAGVEQFTAESSLLNPTNPYAATKASAEMLVMAYRQSYGIPVIVTRGNNVYGSHQYPEKLIPKFLHLAMQGRPLTVHGSGLQQRSYLHVDDVARGFLAVLAKGQLGEVYHIGTLEERTVLEVTKDICKLCGIDYDQVVSPVADRLFNDQRYFMDNANLKALGWTEQVPWEEGLRRTYDWYKANPTWWPNVEGALKAHPHAPGEAAEPREPGQAMVDDAAEEKKESLLAVDGVPMRVLIFGRSGWIGSLLGKQCEEKGITYRYASARLEDRRGLLSEFEEFGPTHVFNAAGKTGRPNVDWCEDNQAETLRSNVIGTMTLADVCDAANVHMTNCATGCIYEYDDMHPLGSGKGFTEEDPPNFSDSFYSKTKGLVEPMMAAYKTCLTLRFRMPITEDLEHPRNFIAKIAKYEKIVNIPNSMTVLPELLPVLVEMARRKLTGVYNFTNPGVVSHNEVMDLYIKHYKPTKKYVNFTLEEQNEILKAGRSNNELDTTKLQKEFPELLPIKESLMKYVFSVQTLQD